MAQTAPMTSLTETFAFQTLEELEEEVRRKAEAARLCEAAGRENRSRQFIAEAWALQRRFAEALAAYGSSLPLAGEWPVEDLDCYTGEVSETELVMAA